MEKAKTIVRSMKYIAHTFFLFTHVFKNNFMPFILYFWVFNNAHY